MKDKKWTIIDTPTQIITLIILILAGIVVCIILYSVVINISWFWILSFFIFLLIINLLFLLFSLRKKIHNKEKKNKVYKLTIISIILIVIIVFYFLYSIHYFEDYYFLEDGTKVQGDTDSIRVIDYTVYTTAETDFTYENLGEGFIHNSKATNYYVSANLKTYRFESIDEKKLTVNFLDVNGNFLDSSWVELDNWFFNRTSKINSEPWVLRISKDSMGDKFGKVEKISFRISESVDSEDNKCSKWISTEYHDERFFGTWINDSIDINDTCPDLFPYYTFYSNGTGMCSHGKFYWDIMVDHRYEYSYIDLNSYNFENLDCDGYVSEYRANLVFEFSNNNEIVTMDNGLYRGGCHYCYGFDYSLDYSKQRDHT